MAEHGNARRMPRLRVAVVVAVAVAVVVALPACTSSGGDGASSPSPKGCTTVASGTAPDGTTEHRVEDLDLRFLLPDTFTVTSDPTSAFVATNADPKAVVTISALDREMDQPDPRSGETIEPWTDGCVEGFTMLDEAMDNLPPGIVANGLVVNDGDRSFIVSISSTPAYLDPTWSTFLDSLAIG